MKTQRPLLALLTICFTAPVFAQDGMLDLRADTDGDKALSPAEVTAAAEQQFSALDADGNGVVSQQEFVDARLLMLQVLDTDGDGRVDRGEMRDAFLAARRNRR